MTVVEKAAYLKGLAEGLGIDADSREGKLWSALNDLLADVARELEALRAVDLGHADALDTLAEELSELEDFVFDTEDEEDSGCTGCGGCPRLQEDGEDDLGPSYDGVIYDATCPACGKEISFDEQTLEEGSITCPNCGELLEFDLSGKDEAPQEPAK